MIFRRGILTKCIYFTISGHAYVEDVSPYRRIIQLDDGDHPVTHDSVWTDVEQRREAIFVAHQEINAPEGDDAARKSVIESDKLKLHGAPLRRDKLFWRRLSMGLWKLFYVAAVFVMTVTFYSVFWLFMWAWFHVWLPI